MTTQEKKINWTTAEIKNLDIKDYPKFCDAEISYLEYEDGTEVSEEELEAITDEYQGKIHELALEHYY